MNSVAWMFHRQGSPSREKDARRGRGLGRFGAGFVGAIVEFAEM